MSTSPAKKVNEYFSLLSLFAGDRSDGQTLPQLLTRISEKLDLILENQNESKQSRGAWLPVSTLADAVAVIRNENNIVSQDVWYLAKHGKIDTARRLDINGNELKKDQLVELGSFITYKAQAKSRRTD